MTPEISPPEVRRAQFRNVLRGLDRVEVEGFLNRVAARMEALEAEIEQLRSAAGAAQPSLEGEFDAVGREVANILQAAREASEAMRERASADAARWRSEAMSEAETNRKEAAADAEALRRDAWVTGTALLEQAAAQARQNREQAERDVLTVMGEAEREAHRLTSAARREAEDMVRNATMSAEKLTADAERRRDDLIEAATRQAAAAQERTRALEQRRDELLEELENVRSTLSQLEASLEERRERLDYSADTSSSVRVVPAPSAQEASGEKTWEFGETVRVVPGESRIPKLPPTEPVVEPVAEAPREPVAEAPAPRAPTEPEAVETQPEVETEPEIPGVAQPEAPAAAVVPSASEAAAAKDGGDLDSLFAALKSTAGEAEPEPSPQAEPQEPAAEPAIVLRGHDWIEDRDARLLPITNRALRGTKKAITELQNIALDQLRTDEKWRPDPTVFANTMGADLITLWAESFAAGHAVAEEMTGTKIKRPPTPHSEGVDEVPAALSAALSRSLDDAGEGQRERQSAASRVFRVWRSDEAEQRLRELAIRAYQAGVEKSVAE